MKEMRKRQCPHDNSRKVSHNVKMCLDCGIFTLKQENSNQRITMIKPIKYNCRVVNNPLVVFNEIAKPLQEGNDPPAIYSDLYKVTRLQQIDYLKSLSAKHKTSQQCFYLALAYLDKVLSSKKIASYYKCDVITIACFLLALKFNDSDPIIPNYSSFTTSNGRKSVRSSDIYKWEIKSLKILEYKLNLITSYNVLDILLMGGIAYADEIYSKPEEFLRNVYGHTDKLIYKVMSSPIITEYYNSVQIAFAVVYISRKIHGLNVYFRKSLMHIYDIHFSFYKECLKDISKYVLNNNSNNNQEQPPQVCLTEHSVPPKKRTRFDEAALSNPQLTPYSKKTTQVFTKLPNIGFNSFMTANTSNTTLYSAMKTTSLFAQNSLTETRNVVHFASEPKSYQEVKANSSHRENVTTLRREKPKSMFHRPTFVLSSLTLPKI